MLYELYEKICSGQNVRANLIELKMQLKSEKNRAEFQKICSANYDFLMKLLVHEDPKVRKNAATVLGLLQAEDAVDVLMDAYLEEEKLFIRADYISALANLPCDQYLDEFRKRLAELTAYHAPGNEKKHVEAEIHALQDLLIRREGIKKHTFTGWQIPNEVILTTLPAFRDILAEAVISRKKILKSGVKTIVNDLHDLLDIRCWNEMLFPVRGAKMPPNGDEIAKSLMAFNLISFLKENHGAEAETPFYFRMQITGPMPMQEKTSLIKKAAASIERESAQKLINRVSGYEFEIRLIPDSTGMLAPYLKLYTIPDTRFRYRKEHIAASMKPYLAAGILSLAKPWMRDYAQVLDPFCGVGTLLIERRFAAPVRNSYGIDTFGEAIDKARINAGIAGLQINYINRNYFDFVHDYLFDEIITDMPTGIRDKKELDTLYRRFFEKTEEILNDHGRLFIFSRELGLVKKHLRLHPDFTLLKEYCISEKSGAWFFILEWSKEVFRQKMSAK